MDIAVQDFANELDKRHLQIGSLLGSGEFAEVFIGTLRKEKKTVNVAIKILRVRDTAVRYLLKIRNNYDSRTTSQNLLWFLFFNFEQIPNTALYTYKSDTSDIVVVFIANFELIQYINLTLLNFQHPIT